MLQTADLGTTEEGRRFIDAHFHRVMASIPNLSPQARNAYDDMSTWLRNVTEQTGVPRQSEYFLCSWLLACNLLYILQHELAASNHPAKQQGEYWFQQIIARMETVGLWHLQFAEDGDVATGIMGDTGRGSKEGEV